MAKKENDDLGIIVGLHLRNRRFEDLKRFNADCKAPKEVEVVQQEIGLDKGVKMVKNKIVTKKLSEKIDPSLNWYDYSIDSLSAVGALDTLKYQTLDGDVLADADNISKTIADIDLENNNEIKTDE